MPIYEPIYLLHNGIHKNPWGQNYLSGAASRLPVYQPELIRHHNPGSITSPAIRPLRPRLPNLPILYRLQFVQQIKLRWKKAGLIFGPPVKNRMFFCFWLILISLQLSISRSKYNRQLILPPNCSFNMKVKLSFYVNKRFMFKDNINLKYGLICVRVKQGFIKLNPLFSIHSGI